AAAMVDPKGNGAIGRNVAIARIGRSRGGIVFMTTQRGLQRLDATGDHAGTFAILSTTDARQPAAQIVVGLLGFALDLGQSGIAAALGVGAAGFKVTLGGLRRGLGLFGASGETLNPRLGIIRGIVGLDRKPGGGQNVLGV